eukprot:CAMPEP_0172427998 /NCGR_PEP_ID=MMETSP1064-20121228/44441_1 /TAXON_ID=202472 /ORGANISM="Aulacoseira subarctica , Strain CCAP 1002/5" /LENGTH=858 /DNA_ID=CAMNT_0013172519 /DNA_START=74 /DNA_END=2651 /DNA_ORIENTATION=-
MSMNAVYCSTGVTCNPFEIKALLEVLDYREEFQSWVIENPDAANATVIQKLRTLSSSYRKAVIRLSYFLAAPTAGKEKKFLSEFKSPVAMELLTCMSAVMHLSQIFLLPYPNTTAVRNINGEEEISLLSNTMPGSLTADTVRYLRAHHLPHKLNALRSNDDVDDDKELCETFEEMLSSDQPEYWGVMTENEFSPFWKLVRSLVLRGCLKDAWDVLSHHSSRSNNREGFLHLRAILLSAPLPGGREDKFDYGFQIFSESNDDEEEDLIIGDIPYNAYEEWGCTSRHATFENHNNDGGGKAAGLRSAKSFYATWSNHVRIVMESGLKGGLLYRIPELRWAVFNVISGSTDSFDGWAEALCAELLYVHPMIRPEDICIRTQVAMDLYGDKNDENFYVNMLILSIMKMDAGCAIDALHKFGGGSSAALPTTLTALFCDLLVLAGCIPKKIVTSSTIGKMKDDDGILNRKIINLRKYLFLSAAWACEACFRATDDEDDEVGVRFASRVLMLEGTSQARSALLEILGRCMPASDAEATAWLSLVASSLSVAGDDLSEISSLIALSRARHYLENSQPGGAAFWMLRGAEAENCHLSAKKCTNNSRGIATIKLGAYCVQLASDLLKSVVSPTTMEETLVTNRLLIAQEVVRSIGQDDAISTSIDGITMSAFSFLCNVTDLCSALLQQKYRDVGSKICSCLVDRPAEDAVTTTLPLAHPTFWLDLFSVAYNILKTDELIADQEQKPSFDVDGIHILMTRLKLLESSFHGDNEFFRGQYNDEIKSIDNTQRQLGGSCIDSLFTFPEMRLLLERGLMRAFVERNSYRKLAAVADKKQKFKEASAFHAPSLLGGLEESIDLLLGPPPYAI